MTRKSSPGIRSVRLLALRCSSTRSFRLEIRDADATTTKASFRLRAFALPPRSELTKDQRDQARILTANQGFYVFREGRLLARGTWLGLRSVEPHFNLSRIEFSFDHQLDDAFQIDIKKSRIQLQRDLQDHLRRLVQPGDCGSREPLPQEPEDSRGRYAGRSPHNKQHDHRSESRPPGHVNRNSRWSRTGDSPQLARPDDDFHRRRPRRHAGAAHRGAG